MVDMERPLNPKKKSPMGHGIVEDLLGEKVHSE